MAAPKTQRRTIQHGLFSYDLPGGGNAIAFRGETVDLLPHDVARGEKYDAFTAEVDAEPPAPNASQLAPFRIDGSEQDHDAWVDSGSIQEILDAVNAQPEIAHAVLEAEQRRKENAREPLLTALAQLEASV